MKEFNQLHRSDLHLAKMLKADEFADYKCKNGLWDVVTPLFINGKHIGNIFTGQFFYDDDVIDESFLRNRQISSDTISKNALKLYAKYPYTTERRSGS